MGLISVPTKCLNCGNTFMLNTCTHTVIGDNPEVVCPYCDQEIIIHFEVQEN